MAGVETPFQEAAARTVVAFNGGLIDSDAWDDYRRLAERGAVLWVPRKRAYVTFGYREANQVLLSPDVTVELKRRNSVGAFGGPTLLDMDGFRHQAIRDAMLSAFKPSVVARYRENVIAPLVVRLLRADGKNKKPETYDWLERVGSLAVWVISGLLGISDDACAWLDTALNPLVDLLDHGRVRASALRTAHKELREFLGQLILADEFRSAEIGRILMSLRDEGLLSIDDVINNSIMFLVAGSATTKSTIGFLAAAYLSGNDGGREAIELAQMRGTLFSELCRISSPVRFTPRFTVSELSINDVKIPAGATVLVCLASANRDPRAFEEGASWRTDRGGSASIAFGRGLHSCLGVFLAEAEVDLIFQLAINRLRSASLVAEPRLGLGWTLRRLTSVVLREGR